MASMVCSLCGHLIREVHQDLRDARNHVYNNCAASIFSFHNIPDDIFLGNFSNSVLPLVDISQIDETEFNQLDFKSLDAYSPLSDIDPDVSYS